MIHYFRRSKFLASLWLVLYLSIHLFYTPTLAGELQVDARAPIDQQPTLEAATNGIPIVNITAPTPAGVSRNTFAEYQVDTAGIIFNNNPSIQPEDLNANKSYLINEPLFPNDNLQGRVAEVILTEVTGVHTTGLLGPTEIYGRSADFILANPNGIYCNGANFINANRVTLTTGQPAFDAQKALDQLHVKKGTIQIVGNGIRTQELGDAKIPTSPLEIVSKVIEINSTLQHPGDLYLYGGEQHFAYQNKQFNLQSASKNKPTNKYVAVDANLLGNVQANRIYIIATQQGVGVRSPKLLAQEEIEITASGDIKLKEVHTNKNLQVTSQEGSIQQEGDKTIVGQDYGLEAKQGNIKLSTPHLQVGGKGLLTSQELTITSPTNLWAEGMAHGHATLTLQVTDKVNNQGTINVTQLVISPLQELTNTGKLHTQKRLALASQHIQQSGEIVVSQSDIHLTGYQQFINGGLILNQQGNLDLQGGTIYNTGKLSTQKQLTLSATTLEQHGVLEGKIVKLAVQRTLQNKKDIYSQGELTITSGPCYNTGELQAEEQLSLTASSLEQQGKIKGGKVKLVVGDILNNHKYIHSPGELIISSGASHNTGEIKAGQELQITAVSLEQAGLVEGQGVQLTVEKAVKNKKRIYSQGALAITSGQFHNLEKVIALDELTIKSQTLQNDSILHTQQGHMTLAVEGAIANQGEISSKVGSVTIQTLGQVTNQGGLLAHQDMSLEAGELVNNKIIQATTGAATIKLTHQLTNQPHAALTSAQDLNLQASKVINQGNIISKTDLVLGVNNLFNKKEGLIQAAKWKSQPFQQLANQGRVVITQDIDLVTDQLTNTGSLYTEQGSMDLQAQEDLLNEKYITSSGGQTIQVGGKFINQGTIKAQRNQTIIANSLDNHATLQSTEGVVSLQIAQGIHNQGKIRSYQGQQLQAASLLNGGEIASEAGPLTIVLQQNLSNEATLHAPMDLALQAKSLTNKQKIYVGGKGQITLSGKLTNYSTITDLQDLVIEASEMANHGTIQSKEGAMKLIAQRQLTNDKLIGSKKDLTVATPLLLNQAEGELYTSQILHLHKLSQFTNAGRVKATTFQQVGSPILQNQGMLQTTADFALTLDRLENRGTLQAPQGTLAINSQQEITHAKGALLHSQQGMSLVTGGAMTNAGVLQTEKGELTIQAANLINQGPLRAPTISLLATQGPLINYQDIISQTGPIILKTPKALINQGQVVAHQDLLVQAAEVANHQAMQATKGQAVFKTASKLSNQPGAKIASEHDMILSAAAIINQGEMTSRAAFNLLVSNLFNKKEGVLQAVTWKSEPFQQFTNGGVLQVFHDIDLVTDKLSNTGKLTSQQGGLKLTVHQDLENEQEIISQGAQEVLVKGSFINEGSLQGATLKIEVHQDLINQQAILSSGKLKLQVHGKLTNSGKLRGDLQQVIETGELENNQEISSPASLSITTQQHTYNTGSIQAGEEVALTSKTLTNTHTGHIKSAGPSHLMTEGLLKNAGKIESKQDINLTSSAATLTNEGNLYAQGAVQLEAPGAIKHSGRLLGKKVAIATQDTFTSSGSLEPLQALTVQAKSIENNQEINPDEATLELTATEQITNKKPIRTKNGSVQLKGKGLDNQSEIASGKQLVVDVRQLINQEGAALISHEELQLKDMDQLDNSGKINASSLIQSGVPVFTNQAQGEIQAHTTTKLTTQNFINQGTILITQGDLVIQSKKDITQASGQLITQDGHMTLQAPVGNLANAGDMMSSKNLEIAIGKNLDNHAFLGATDKLAIQGARLHNAGKIQATGATSLIVEAELANQGQVASGGNLTISQQRSSLILINEGMLQSGATLEIQARQLTNKSKGKLQAKVGQITVTECLENIQDIQIAETGSIKAGRLKNQGELVANQALDISVLQGDVDNSGKIASNLDQVKIAIHQGSLSNTAQLSSNKDLELTVARQLENSVKITAGALLTLNTASLHNRGTISSKGAASLTISELTNSGILGSWNDLTLQVTKGLNNQKAGQIASIEGSLLLTAAAIHNQGAINPGEGSSKIIAEKGDFSQQGTIQARGELVLKAAKLLANKGKVVAQKDLLLVAPLIQHAHHLQSNQGNLTLDAQQQIENSGKLVSFQALKLQTAKLINQADLGSDQDLILAIPTIENTQKLFAGGKLEIRGNSLTNHGEIAIVNTKTAKQAPTKRKLYIDVETLTNRGKILGGEGDNLVKVDKLLTNYHQIATLGPLTIQAAPADLVNHAELTANKQLILEARNLSNTYLIQGDILTDLTITGEILNQGMIASAGNLTITAGRINHQVDRGYGFYTTKIRSGDSPYEKGFEEKIEVTRKSLKHPLTLLANGIITLQTGEMQGHDIQAGKGDKDAFSKISFTKDQAIQQRNVISSAGSLQINLFKNQVLHNYNQIRAANKLTIQGGAEVYNHPKAHLQGGIVQVEFDQGSYNSQRLVNEGTLMGLEELRLRLPRGNVVNEARLQAGNLLHIDANGFYNNPSASTLSGGAMSIEANYIKNDQGELFAQGNMVLKGQDGELAVEVVNVTGDQQARIESMRDITIQANKLENRGKVIKENGTSKVDDTKCTTGYKTAPSRWNFASGNNSTAYGKWGRAYCCDEYDSRHGKPDLYFTRIRKEELTSDVHTQAAYINARGDMYLHIKDRIDNLDSQLVTNGTMQVDGTSYGDSVPENTNLSGGLYINNSTHVFKKTLSDAYVYRKEWEDKANVGFLWSGNQYTTCYRVLHESKEFILPAVEKSTIRAGKDLKVDSKTFNNGCEIIQGTVSPCADPLAQVEGHGLLNLDDFDLPKGDHGLFILSVDTTLPVDSKSVEIPPIQTSPVELPTLQPIEWTPIEIQVDQELAKELAPSDYHTAAIQEVLAPDMSILTTEQLASLPVTDSAIRLQAIEPVKSLLAESVMNYELSTDSLEQAAKRELASDPIDHQAAPPIEPVKFTCLPPLVRSSVPVDESKFYGSPYFLRHVGLDPGQRGAPANPLRFLGDPFYESRIIGNAIQKATARALLYEDVVTPEEQIKVLIDNTALVAKDLQVGLGVALSKEQINSLQKDILWYEEKTVKGQQVLVPQVYLTQETIKSLRSKPTGGIRSGGTMTLKVQEKLTNTGNISSKGDMEIRAHSLHNESFGNTQATIQSTQGALDLQIKKDIDNISGKIAGATATKVISQEGAIYNTTKLLDESTLGMQASIGSGGNLTLQAKGDIVNKAAKVQAMGDATIQSETGDVKFLTQEVKKKTIDHTSSHHHGFLSSSHSSSTTTNTKNEHAVSELEIAGNATIKGRDIALMGTQATVGKDLNLDASRDIQALAVKDLTETTQTSVEHQQEDGLFTNKSTSKSNSSTHRESTSKGINFKIGGSLGVQAGGNADFEGAQVTAKNVKMDVKGETTIRNAYDETRHEERVDEKKKDEALFGLLKDNKSQKSHSQSNDQKATGNTWKVEDKFEVQGKGNVTTQAMNLEAHQFKIVSTQGNVFDKAAEEVHESLKEVDSYSHRQGLLVSKKEDVQWQGEEGRVSMKLREKKEEKTQTKDNHSRAQRSSFKTHAKVVAREDGQQVVILGNGTFQAAQKVVLEATEAAIEGKLTLQGKEGVSIVAKKETEGHQEHKEGYTETWSVGLKNSLVAAGYQGVVVKEALAAEAKAIKAYTSYQDQLKAAKALYKDGQITEKDYQAVVEEEKFHQLSVAAATVAVLSKTKQFLASTANAIKTAGATGGFSIDLQADIRKTVDEVMRLSESAKGSKIKTAELEVITEETFELVGGEVEALASEIKAKDMQVKSFVGQEESKQKGNSQGFHGRVDTNLTLDASLNVENSEGKRKGVEHTHSQLKLGKTKLQIEKDVLIQGQVETTSVEGQVGGDVRIETLLDTMKGSDRSVGGSIGFGIGLSSGKVSGGASYGQGVEDTAWTKVQAGLTSSDAFKLKVGGKTYLKGGMLGSEQVGKTDLQTQEIIKEDIDTYQRSSNWKVGGSVNGSKGRGGSEVKKGGKVDFSYNRSNARQKVVSSIGPSKPPIDYLNTQSELKVDSEMAKLAIKPMESVKEVVEDSKVIYTAAEDITIATIHAFKNPKGALGTLKDFQNVLVDLGTITSLAQDKAHVEKINNATELNKEELEQTLDNQFDYQQDQGGVPSAKRASVHLYQGDDQVFDKGGAKDLRGYKGGYDTKNNQVYVNTSKTDISNGRDIQKVLFTEQQRKETNDSSWLNKLNKEEQKNLAYDRGDRAGKNWGRFSKPSTKFNRAAVANWNDRNQGSLKKNNEWISGVDGSKVNPRLDMEGDPLMRKFFESKGTAKVMRGFIPVVGSGEAAVDAFQEGKYIQGSLYTGLAVAELVPFVGLAKDGIKLANTARKISKLGNPVVSEVVGQVEKQVIKEMEKAIVKASKKSFFLETKYSNKVLGQIKTGDFHAFPELVRAFEKNGFTTTIQGGDGVTRQMLKIHGIYRGKQGFFEFIKEADGTINHRLFRPTSQ